MAVEIEAKMKVDNLATIREALRIAKATSLGKVSESNTFFDLPGETFRNSDKGVRLRKSYNDQTGETSLIVTYKGPNQPGLLKSREEIEISVNSWESTITLFEKLGFSVTFSFEKRRETWQLDSCKVELDEIPHLGTFVEIEGPSESNILRVRQTLSLAQHPFIKAGYASLLRKHAKETGLDIKSVRFANPFSSHRTTEEK